MAVHQDRPVRFTRAVEEQQRRAPGDAPDVEDGIVRRVLRHERLAHLERRFHVAVRLPVGVEEHGDVRHGDVLGEGGEDLVLPETVEEVAGVAHGARF